MHIQTPQNVNTRLNNILMPTFEKVSKENKNAYQMGDFNINLINYDCHNPTTQFLEGIFPISFFPQ